MRGITAGGCPYLVYESETSEPSYLLSTCTRCNSCQCLRNKVGVFVCCRWSEGAQRSPTMSHHSDDNMLIASSDSFWEPGNYKRTTKRIEDGYKLCNELITLVQERSDIEKTYAKSLKSWSKKWNDLIEKGALGFGDISGKVCIFTRISYF